MVIVIGSYRGSPWLQQCIDSIPSKWETLVVRAASYECGALRFVMDRTTINHFLFLQDSTMVKDPSWLETCAGYGGSVSLNADPRFHGSFMGTYTRHILSKCTIPETPDKMSAVLAEMSLGDEYASHEPNQLILWPELNLASARYEEKNGRTCAVYENEFFVKWKSCYGGSHITPAQERDDAHKLRYP